ncbi:MAG: response regulator [Pseudomonadota bacterium]
MSGAPIRVLIVEDDVVDRMACRRAFAADTTHEVVVIEADTGRQGLDMALAGEADCILLDYRLPDLTGLEFLACLATESGAAPELPIMMLTGADSAAVAAEAMRRGAQDYMVKDVERLYLGLLPGAIHRMLRERALLKEKHQLEAKFRTLVEQIQAITYIAPLGETDALQYISPQIGILGFTPAEWLATPGLHQRQMHPDDRAAALQAIRASRAQGLPLQHEYRLFRRDGTPMWFRDEARLVRDDGGRHMFMQGILVDITRSKLVEEALRHTQRELHKMVAHKEDIKERERKRIAQEIHDELGGLLTGINAYLSVSIERAARAGAAPDPLLADAAGLTRDAMETVRKVITDLRPSVLDQLGVWSALEWYADQITQRSGLACTCRIAPDVATIELDAERSTMLFRIVQEALTNVVRHADATSAGVALSRLPGKLLLTVRDDGKGIEAERLLNRESWGILGMHERSRHFGGELKISGTPGQGTCLVLQLPLEDSDVV